MKPQSMNLKKQVSRRDAEENQGVIKIRLSPVGDDQFYPMSLNFFASLRLCASKIIIVNAVEEATIVQKQRRCRERRA